MAIPAGNEHGYSVEKPPIRILLVDDHDIVREAISLLFDSAQGMQLVGSAATGEEAVLAALRLRPDVVVMDLGLPGLSGMDATRNIVEDLPDTRVVAFSGYQSAEYVQQAFAAGARGYVLKESAGMDLLSAVSAVAAGHRYTSPAVTSLVA